MSEKSSRHVHAEKKRKSEEYSHSAREDKKKLYRNMFNN